MFRRCYSRALLCQTAITSRAASAAAASATKRRTLLLTYLDPETALRDSIVRDLRPHHLRSDVPLLAATAHGCEARGDRIPVGAVPAIEATALRTLSMQCPQSVRSLLAAIDRSDSAARGDDDNQNISSSGAKFEFRRRLSFAQPHEVLGFHYEKRKREVLKRIMPDKNNAVTAEEKQQQRQQEENMDKIYNLVFSDNHRFYSLREIRDRICKEVLVPSLRQLSTTSAATENNTGGVGGGGVGGGLAIPISRVEFHSGWFMFAHLFSEYLCLVDVLLQSGGRQVALVPSTVVESSSTSSSSSSSSFSTLSSSHSVVLACPDLWLERIKQLQEEEQQQEQKHQQKQKSKRTRRRQQKNKSDMEKKPVSLSRILFFSAGADETHGTQNGVQLQLSFAPKSFHDLIVSRRSALGRRLDEAGYVLQ